jgi:hypothetical protein
MYKEAAYNKKTAPLNLLLVCMVKKIATDCRYR